jgi:heat shock protein HslJ
MKQFLFLFGSIILLSCSAGDKLGEKHVYWINSTKAPCVGRAPTSCLQVQKSENLDPSAWKSFQSSIIGFEYEPGYIYKIVVKERHLDPAELPADVSSIEYTLVEILEKREDMKMRINDIWEALQIREESILTKMEGISPPQLEIHVGEMRYMGNDGCNNYNGGIIELDETTIRFGIAAGTRMMCPDMHIPELFNSSLPEVQSWEIKENRLHLFNAEGKEVMQLKKIN